MKKADEVASLFLTQKLTEQKERVDRWVKDVLQADQEGKEAYSNLFLHETCNLGTIRVIISTKQGSWLYRVIAKELHTRGKRFLSHTGQAFSEGQEVGSWSYGESDDPYERIIFHLDPAFVQAYMQVDTVVLDRVAQQINKE